GNWAARAEIAEVALPLLFNSLEGLRIDETRDTAIGGWVFRGMLKLPVTWSTARKEPDYGKATTGGAASAGEDAAGQSLRPRVAMIGAGRDGCFSAEELLRQVPGSHVDGFDRLPVPFGRLRHGVA